MKRLPLQFFVISVLLLFIGIANATPEAGEIEYESYVEAHKAVSAVAWQPNGNTILFVRDGDDAEQQEYIYKVQSDGTGMTQLTTSGNDAGPIWSPDGLSIAFASSRGGGDFFKMDATGGNTVSLGYHADSLYLSSWSPNGQQIAFTTRRGDGGPYIATMTAAGVEQHFITTGFDAYWHPTGQFIVLEDVSSDKDPDSDLYYNHIFEINLSTHQRIQLTFGNYDDEGPNYSPDGEWIVFNSDDRGTDAGAGSSICLMRRDGTATYCVPLHFPPEWVCSQASFSPDGQSLVFGAGKYIPTDLYICNRDGTGLHHLTSFYNTMAKSGKKPVKAVKTASEKQVKGQHNAKKPEVTLGYTRLNSHPVFTKLARTRRHHLGTEQVVAKQLRDVVHGKLLKKRR